MSYKDVYRKWCEDSYFDENTKKELISISDNDEEIQDRFYRDLEFGTGGLRGVIGAGTNRLNIYTVRKASQGLSNVIISENGQEKGVVIAYDSRRMSAEFANEAALNFNANGIKTYIFESLRPTPELSFAVRELKCIAGIVITASHNPPEYNGYKVYWEDGAQITYPKDEEIIYEVNKVSDYSLVKMISKEEALSKGYYHVIGKEIDDRYMEELKKQSINPEIIKEVSGDLKIVYTPLHGAGNIPVQTILKELGFENVHVVPEQEKPDGNFPTVSYPNPEDPAAFGCALKLAKAVGADIVLATDPDADRLGVYVKACSDGEYVSFTGNMSGMIIAEYLLSQKAQKGILPKNGALVKTIVTTNMADAVAKGYNIKLIEVLTGFKYIGEQIKLFEEQNTYQYVFGLEESYGCLAGTYARDKDAVVAVMLLCEAAAFYKKQGLTLWEQMKRIFDKYGYYREGLETITLRGIEGSAKIKEMMEKLREKPPEIIGNYRVIAFRDYQNDVRMELLTGKTMSTGLPKSNVLYYELEENAWCCVRPSGTEPKIKFYMGIKGDGMEDAGRRLRALTDALLKIVKG